MDKILETQADNIVSKIHHYLITMMGQTIDETNDEQFYLAFSHALREEVMINWTATSHSFEESKSRMVYYLSMEYMPGRLLGNNITNISATDLVQCVLKKMNRNFSKILSQESDIGVGNGGLGRLASCFMDSLATQQYPAMGYGMRYQYGIFEQDLWCGIQIERPDCWLLTKNPWEFRRDRLAVSIEYAGKPISRKNRHGEEVYNVADPEEVRSLPYDLPIIGYRPDPSFSVLTLRLWSTKESPKNFQLQRYNAGQLDEASENTSLTDVLYPNDNHETGKRIRLKQEFLLVSASIQDIITRHLTVFGDLKDFGDKVRIQINDTHPALAVSELMRILTNVHDMTWGEAFEITTSCISYTNHTVLKEALEEWNQNRLHYLLPRQYHVIERLNDDFMRDVRKAFPNDEERVKRMSIIEGGQVRMANLSIYGSHKVNGVAKLHSEILKESIFRDFYEMYPDRFTNVTNGVTQRRWLLHCNPSLAEFITARIGNKWITDFSEIAKLRDYAEDPESQAAFLEIKKENKQHLLDYIIQTHKEKYGEVNPEEFLDTDAIFDVQIKRLHEYKRQFMNGLHALMLYNEIKKKPDSRKVKRLILIGGKAAPGYFIAKNVIRFIYCLSRKIMSDPVVSKKLRLYFFPNYNVSNAEKIIPASDLSVQISTAGMEASGTGNMKLSMNGSLTIGTEDGANIEMHEGVTDKWWPFSFGASAEENHHRLAEKNYSPWTNYNENAALKEAIDALQNGSLAENEAEHEALHSLYINLMEGPPGGMADRYFILDDLPHFYEAQKKVEELYLDRNRWAQFALHNIAGMGHFSTDRSIRDYADDIWGVTPCPPSNEQLAHIRAEYSRYDRCRILQTG